MSSAFAPSPHSSFGSDGGPPRAAPYATLDQQAAMASKAAQVTSEALEKEEVFPEEAVRLYRIAFGLYVDALELQFAPKDINEACLLCEKLQRNCELVQERLSLMESKVVGQRLPSVRRRAPAASVRSQQRQAQGHEASHEAPSRSARAQAAASEAEAPVPATSSHGAAAASGQGAAAAVQRKEPDLSALKGIEQCYQRTILNEIVDDSPGVSFDDIAGLKQAKRALEELVILPSLRPELFTGLRAPAKGLLLFGPPGNGKTMLAKAVASEAKCTFFSLSASSLTARYLGDSEKLVKALFAIARVLQPALIFVDEIDSLLSSRSDNEHDAMRRLKTEFLTQLDGVGGSSEDRILVMGATNRPYDLDDAMIRRMPKRIYVTFPDVEARRYLLEHVLKGQVHRITPEQFDDLAMRTEKYSGCDLMMLCKDAAMNPVREVGYQRLRTIPLDALRPVEHRDIIASMQEIRPSVSEASLSKYEDWNATFGSLVR